MIAVAAFLLPVVPLLALLVFLLLGRYPGCEAIVRLSERISARGRRTVSPTPHQPVWPPMRAASGGLLLACGLCGRAPPA